MKLLRALATVGALAVLFTVSSGHGRGAADPGAGPPRVGVFDSRAVAIVYARSDAFNEEMRALKAEHDAAKSAGEEELAASLEKKGLARQQRLHRQGFSTAPVDDALAAIQSELPAIAERAGVDLIVNRWRVAYRAPDAETVDVTDLLVQAFHPDEKALAIVAQVREQEPLPLYDTDWASMRDH